ncbi:NTF2 fold immunity protein [Pasteurella sp. PK-2025]|uniref:NTF2 fold immunity protein n=1 Tax=Pasteurella sp. PK-2025 TaxID=3413133 RepID=UPI003C738034
MENVEKVEIAQQTLLEFLDKINNWNIYAAKYIKSNGFNAQIKKELIEPLKVILKKYCTEKLSKDLSASCSEISGYDIHFLSIDKYEIITKNKICFFITESNRSKNTYRYTMIYRDEKWRIDQKQVFRKFNNKWEKSYI